MSTGRGMAGEDDVVVVGSVRAAPGGFRRPERWGASGRVLALAATVMLTLVPIVRMAAIVLGNGADTPSSDDIALVTHLIGPVFDGGYQWSHYFRDTFDNTHALVLPGLVYLVVAALTHLNTYVILVGGIMVATGRLILLHGGLNRASERPWERLALWPLLAALTFSASQVSLFEQGFSSMSVGLGQFGVALGVWGLARFPGRWRGIWLMALGGVIATFSCGCGLLAWPAFLLGLILLGFRRAGAYVVWAAAATLTALPYVAFLLLWPIPGAQEAAVHSLARALAVPVLLLGLPLAQQFARPIAGVVGLVGGVLAATGLLLVWRGRTPARVVRAAPALMLIAYSLGVAVQIGLFRGRLAPWYTYVGAEFWIGLLGLACALRPERATGARQPGPFLGIGAAPRRAWRTATLATLAILYATSNLTWADKSIFLRTRSPASAACVRHYRVAPLGCAQLLQPYSSGTLDALVALARPLERHQLGPFAPHQEWTLQGDRALELLGAPGGAADGGGRWSTDLSARSVAPTDPGHLNLLLRPPDTLTWTVRVPDNATRADFRSAIAVGGVPAPGAPPVLFEIAIARPDEPYQALVSRPLAAAERRWQPVTVPLGAYAGQQVTIRLSVVGAPDTGAWGAYRYPVLDLTVDPSRSAGPEAAGTPSRRAKICVPPRS